MFFLKKLSYSTFDGVEIFLLSFLIGEMLDEDNK